MSIDGVEFKQGAAIVHSVTDDLPQVAQIDTIYVINGSTLVFKAECYATTSYVRHLHAYTIASLHKYSFFYHDKLSSSSRVHSYTKSIITSQTGDHAIQYF